MSFKGECYSTAIGSFPHKTAREALTDIFETLTDIPVWPQLPTRSYLEGMCPQYSEGVPTVSIDTEEKKIRVDTGDDLPFAMEKFYETFLSEETEPFALSEEFAPGLFEFGRSLSKNGSSFKLIKGHTTGPVTWGLTVCDAEGKASYYNDMLKDGVVKALQRKTSWQVEYLKQFNDNVIIFIDEPYLQSMGSATVPITENDVTAVLNEVIEGVHSCGALAGIHCCGNTDWSLLCHTNTDIVNFDAFQYAESLSLYKNDVRQFLDRGGVLAWGIVPSTEEIDSQDINSMTAAFKDAIRLLIKAGVKENEILENALVTPSCGAGSLSPSQSRKMLDLTAELSRILRGS